MSERESNKIDDVSIEAVKAFLLEAYKRDKKLPSIKVLAERFHVSEYRMLEVFRILVHEGFLKRNYSRYRMSETKPNQKVDPKTYPSLVTLAEEKDNKVEKDWVLGVMRGVLGFIGLGAIGVSTYYTSVWFLEYLPAFLAVFLALIMVFFSTMAFEVVIVVLKAEQWFMAVGFSILFIVVLLFSMMSTIAGQYNQRLQVENAAIQESSDVVQARAAYELLVKQEKQIVEQIEGQKSLRKVYQGIFDSYDAAKREADLKGYNEVRAQIDKVDKSLLSLNAKLMDVQAQELAYLEKQKGPGTIAETSVKTASFFVWVAGLFDNKIKADMIQFYFSVFPAVFVDLIAPFSLAFAFFQRGESKKNKENLLKST